MSNLITLAALGSLTLAVGETERDAILLECCELPDKQLTLSEADLDGIVSRFAAPVPIKLQHMDSPLDPFGVVTSVRRVGQQLLGKIVFPPAIADFVRERGAAALSCGLDRSPLSLAEVSLVLKGRIPAATLLADEERAELDRLRVENLAQKVEAQVIALKLAGKIIPASEAAARILLGAGDTERVTLSDGGTQAVSAAFLTYLAAQPAVVTLGELTQLGGGPAGAAASTLAQDDLTPDQREWLEKSLGVKADRVQETIRRDKSKEANTKGHGRRDSVASPMGGKKG